MSLAARSANRVHVFRVLASSVQRPVKTVVVCEMSDVIEPGLELLERQNRFVSDHFRRIFVQIYHLVQNVADAQDLTQEAFIKALQHQEQLKDGQKPPSGCRASPPIRRSIFCGAAAAPRLANLKMPSRATPKPPSRFCSAPSIANIWKMACAFSARVNGPR